MYSGLVLSVVVVGGANPPRCLLTAAAMCLLRLLWCCCCWGFHMQGQHVIVAPCCTQNAFSTTTQAVGPSFVGSSSSEARHHPATATISITSSSTGLHHRYTEQLLQLHIRGLAASSTVQQRDDYQPASAPPAGTSPTCSPWGWFGRHAQQQEK